MLPLARVTKQNFDQFLEREQPIRQLHIARADDFTPLGERCRIFVVRIEQHEMRSRIFLEDCAQNQRGRARFTSAGRTQNGKVLAEQIVDLDHRRNRRVLTNAPNAHRSARITHEGHFKFGLRRNPHAIAKCRVERDAAIERSRFAVLRTPQLANETQFRNPDFLLAFALRRHWHAQR